MSATLRDVSLADIVPPNLQQDEQIRALIAAIDPELRAVSESIVECLILPRIDELEAPVLDLLAWELHCDFYDLAGTLTMKREHVKNSILLHMRKGTVWAIKEALRQLDIQAEFVPWWESGDPPYTFRLKTIVAGDFYRTVGKDALIANINRAVNEAKSARSYMIGLETELRFTEDVALCAGVAMALLGFEVIGLTYPDMNEEARAYVGVVEVLQGEQRISLQRDKELSVPMYVGVAEVQNWELEVGVDIETMQELLLQFEKRIFNRLDEHEVKIMKELDDRQAKIDARLEAIIDLLTWQDE